VPESKEKICGLLPRKNKIATKRDKRLSTVLIPKAAIFKMMKIATRDPKLTMRHFNFLINLSRVSVVRA
jgi:hypothetical protein